MFLMPDGKVICKIVLEPGFSVRRTGIDNGVKSRYGKSGSETSGAFLKRIGAKPIPGFQLRYIYFLNPAARERLTVPILPFSRIAEMGASMYRGERTRPKQATPATSGEAAGQNRPGRSNLSTAGTDEPA